MKKNESNVGLLSSVDVLTQSCITFCSFDHTLLTKLAALKTIHRDATWEGLGANLNTRCLELNAFKTYLFQAWFKVLNQDGVPVVCDPEKGPTENGCPTVTIFFEDYANKTTKAEVVRTFQSNKAITDRPYDETKWNSLTGLVKITGEYAGATRVFFYIENAPIGMEYLVDNVSFTLLPCDVMELVKNGDFESGKSEYKRFVEAYFL